MKLGLTAVVGALAALSYAGTAFAKEFKYDVTNCSVGESRVIVHTYDNESNPPKSHIVWSEKSRGVSRGDFPGMPAPGASSQCVGVGAVMNGVWRGNGFCEYVNNDGDKVLGEWKGEAGKGTWTFISGTGKYKGITGSGTWESLGQFPQFQSGTYQNCGRAIGAYKLP